MFYPHYHLNRLCVCWGWGSCIIEYFTHKCTLIKLGCLITPENAALKQLAEWHEAGRQEKSMASVSWISMEKADSISVMT